VISCIRYISSFMLAAVTAGVLFASQTVHLKRLPAGELLTIRAGQSNPQCVSSDHEDCPHDGSCTDIPCDVITVACPDPDNPGSTSPVTLANCNASDTVYTANKANYPTCDYYGFNGFRGQTNSTTTCGIGSTCKQATATCTSPNPCDPGPGGTYYCPPAYGTWPVIMNSCTPDRTKKICRSPTKELPVSAKLVALANANGLFYRLRDSLCLLD
jgi:hypothetical protein